MRPSTLILPTLASSIAASSTARSAGSAALYFADTNALVPAAFLAAHSLAHDSTATTYLLGCHASYDFSGGTFQDDMLSSFCRHKMPITMTQGPSTVAFRRGLQFRAAGATLTLDFQCSLAGTTLADCSQTLDGAAKDMARYTSYAGKEYADITSAHHDILTGTHAASFFTQVPLVTDAASIMHGRNARPVETGASRAVSASTPEEGGAGGVFTGAGEEGAKQTKMLITNVVFLATSSQVTSMSAATETVATLETSAVSKTAEASASAPAAPTVEGSAGKMMGLGAWAAAMVAGVLGVAAL